jgi:hypothetical protein
LISHASFSSPSVCSALAGEVPICLLSTSGQLWLTEGTVDKHVRSILRKLNLPETADDHRRGRALITFLESR